MPLTELDPTTALILIDLQKGIVSRPMAQPIGPVLANAAKLAEAFRAANLPVVLVNVDATPPGRAEQSSGKLPPPGDWTELAPELNAQSSDIRLTKHAWGAFTNTGLAEQLKGLGVTQVVLGGVSTSIGVETTARAAFEHGFNVTLATDAMTDTSAEAQENSLKRIFPRLGETGTTHEVIDLLDRSRS